MNSPLTKLWRTRTRDAGQSPCSEAGNSIGAGGDGESAGTGGLPSFVPARYREPILRAAARWNVSAALIAAQIMAESNFNPSAVSPAGAQGIAQFMPGTAASYGLEDPFDPERAIDAQARMMSDLLRRFRSIPLALAAYNAGPGAVAACDCVPPYPGGRPAPTWHGYWDCSTARASSRRRCSRCGWCGDRTFEPRSAPLSGVPDLVRWPAAFSLRMISPSPRPSSARSNTVQTTGARSGSISSHATLRPSASSSRFAT